MPDRPGLDDDEAFKELINLWRAGSDELDRQAVEVLEQIRFNIGRIGTDKNAKNAVRRLRIQAARLDELSDVASAIVDDAAQGTEEFITGGGFDRIYSSGAARVQSLPFSFTAPHRAAVDVLARDTFEDVLGMTSFVDARSKDFVRRVSRQLTGFKLTDGTPVKTQARRFRREIEREFRSRGIDGVQYRDGSMHSFGEYSEMLLRTKTGVAYNAGTMNQGRAAGIEFYELLDGADCGLTSHRDEPLANGLIVNFEVAAGYPLSHPNAFMGGQLFNSIESLRQIVKARYSGPSFSFVTSEDDRVTVTPEHPVLTARGWVAADRLVPGDYVMHYERGSQPGLSGTYFDQGASAHDGYAACVEVGSHAVGVPSADDLHGAGKFCYPEIDVVDLDAPLWDHLESLGLEDTRQGFLSRGLLSDALVSLGAPDQRLSCVGLASSGLLSRGDHRGPLLVGGSGPSGFHRLGTAWHRIASIERGWYSGSVYDASTAGESYTVNGIVVANCRRSVNPRPDITSANKADAVSVQSPEARADQAAFEEAFRQQAATAGSRQRPARPSRSASGGSRSRPARNSRPKRSGAGSGQRQAVKAENARRRAAIEKARSDSRVARARFNEQRLATAGSVDGIPDGVLDRWGVTPDQYLNARAVAPKLKADVRAAAEREANDIGTWLFDNDLSQMTRPTRLKRKTDISGQTRSVRSQSGYDFLEGLDDAELARVRGRFIDSDLYPPDVVADQVRRKTNLDLSDDEAMDWLVDRWLHEDGLRSLSSGRIPKYANPDNLLPGDYALDGYELGKLFGVDIEEATGHIARVQAEAGEEIAERILGTPSRGPAPWEMDMGDYLRELESIEDVLSNAPAGQASEAARLRLLELAPSEIDPGGSLNPFELYEEIRIIAQAAGRL